MPTPHYILFAITLVVILGGATPAVTSAQQATSDNTALIDDIIRVLESPTAPTGSDVAGFSRDGVYGCTGASFGPVGAQGPRSAHVPTFDDAVHDQTRLLTYKECVLDGVYRSMRETMVSSMIRSVVHWNNTGFDGNPAFVSNLPLHLLERVSDPTAERVITGAETEVLAGPFRRDIRVNLARNYARETRSPERTLACDLSDAELEGLSQGTLSRNESVRVFETFLSDPACNPLFAYGAAERYLQSSIASERERELTQLEWGSGFRSLETEREVDLGDGESITFNRIVTPGAMIAEQLGQTLGTGLRQAENADEIDEIIITMMANVGTETLIGQEGLSGLSRSFGGDLPYVDRLAQETASRTRGVMVGTASQTVSNTLRIEREYASVWDRALASLYRSARQLQSWESTCWSGHAERAAEDLADEVRARVCPAQNNDESVQCSVAVETAITTPVGELGFAPTGTQSIIVEGQATRTNSRVEVEAGDGTNTLSPTRATVTDSGRWSTPAITLTDLADGTITLSADEEFAASGNAGTVTRVLQKRTQSGVMTLLPPAHLPPLTISARAGNHSATTTIVRNVNRSESIISRDITPVIELIRTNIDNSEKAQEALLLLRNGLEGTTSSSAQRFLLEQLDRLITARALHTESELREARTRAVEIEGAMGQLLESTRESWEEGWCDPANWRSYSS